MNKNKAGGITLSDFKLYYNDLVISKYVNVIKTDTQPHGIESSEINPCIYGQLIFTREPKNTQWQKIKFSINGFGENGYSHADPYLTPLTKINSKWIKDLNIRLETMKHLEKTV